MILLARRKRVEMTYHGRTQNGLAVLDEPVKLPDGTRILVEVGPAVMEFWGGPLIAATLA